MKEIWYMGNMYLVPKYYKYVATDINGDVYTYLDEPECIDGNWLGTGAQYLGLVSDNIDCGMEKI